MGKDFKYLQDCGFLIERPGFLDNESGYRNLKYLAAVNHKISQEKIRESIRQVGLDPTEKKPVGKYSLGMRQRLGTAFAIEKGWQANFSCKSLQGRRCLSLR